MVIKFGQATISLQEVESLSEIEEVTSDTDSADGEESTDEASLAKCPNCGKNTLKVE
jgi:hypothetical protein